mgnify:CR=1 FL=1
MSISDPNFEILLTMKLKEKPINRSLDVIEVVQAYDFDWNFYLIDSSISKARAEVFERLTPFPASMGAVSFPDLIFDEEGFLESAESYLSREELDNVKKLLDVGYPISDYLDEDILWRIVSKNSSIIRKVRVEAYIPITSEACILSDQRITDFENLSSELVKTSYYYIDPSLALKSLDESRFLHEYLDKLAALFSESAQEENKGLILIIRGEFPADRSLVDLEENVDALLEPFKSKVLQRTLMFNRIM